jgi:hypothetical protein
LPAITVTKTANPTSVVAPGGSVTFTFTVTNNAAEPATISELSDNKFGTLAGDADCQLGTVLAANGGNCSFQATFNVTGAGGTTHVDVFTGKATDDDGNTATDTDDAEVRILAPIAQITPTTTTCQDYRGGTAANLTDLFYTVNKGKVGSVAEGVMFYYATIKAPSSSFSFTVTQQNTASWKAMAIQDVGQVIVWKSDCTKLTTTTANFNSSTGTVSVNVTGATAGDTYYLSIKYVPSSLAGQPVSAKPTVTYTFQIPDLGADILLSSTDSVKVNPKK